MQASNHSYVLRPGTCEARRSSMVITPRLVAGDVRGYGMAPRHPATATSLG